MAEARTPRDGLGVDTRVMLAAAMEESSVARQYNLAGLRRLGDSSAGSVPGIGFAVRLGCTLRVLLQSLLQSGLSIGDAK